MEVKSATGRQTSMGRLSLSRAHEGALKQSIETAKLGLSVFFPDITIAGPAPEDYKPEWRLNGNKPQWRLNVSPEPGVLSL